MVFSNSIQETISISNQVSNSVCCPAESTVDSERVPVWGEVEFSPIDYNFLTGSLLEGVLLLSPCLFIFFLPGKGIQQQFKPIPASRVELNGSQSKSYMKVETHQDARWVRSQCKPASPTV